MNEDVAIEALARKPSEHRARLKVLDPLTSIGPSMEAELLNSSEFDLQLWAPRYIIPGSIVQVLTSKKVVLGKVWLSTESGAGFEVEVAVEPA